VAGLVVLSTVRVALGAQALLLWEYDPSPLPLPPPDTFVLVLRDTADETMLTVPRSQPGACGANLSPQTYCATLPQCPSEGLLQYTVQARWADGVESATSAPMSCVFRQEAACRCLPVDVSPLPPPSQDPAMRPPVVELPPLQTAPPQVPALPTFPTLPVSTAPV